MQPALGHLAGHRPRIRESNAHAVDIQALLGREGIAITQVYAHEGQERLGKSVVDT